MAPSTAVQSVIETMQTDASGSVLVCEDEKLVGILTERDVLKLMGQRADFQAPVQQVMTANPVTVAKGDTVGKAIQLMAGGGYRRIPIVDGSKPMGVLLASDVLHYLVEHFPEFVYNLPPAPHHATQQREGA